MTLARVHTSETGWWDKSFGYLWWIDTARNVSFMAGHGGQYVFVNKNKNLIVVITSEKHTMGDFNLLPDEALSIYDRINSITK